VSRYHLKDLLIRACRNGNRLRRFEWIVAPVVIAPGDCVVAEGRIAPQTLKWP
jgi:hypothetical protein